MKNIVCAVGSGIFNKKYDSKEINELIKFLSSFRKLSQKKKNINLEIFKIFFSILLFLFILKIINSNLFLFFYLLCIKEIPSNNNLDLKNSRIDFYNVIIIKHSHIIKQSSGHAECIFLNNLSYISNLKNIFTSSLLTFTKFI